MNGVMKKNSNYGTDARDYNDNRTSEDNKAKTPDRRKIRRRRLQIFSACSICVGVMYCDYFIY